MKSAVMLPYNESRFTTYHSLATAGMVANNNPTAENWYYNRCIQWICYRDFLRGHTSPELNIAVGHLWDMDFTEKYVIKNQFIRYGLREVVTAVIEDGYYISFGGVDDYYVAGKSWYQEKHTNHDGAILGYDNIKNTFLIAAYDSRWIYRCFETTQESFLQGFQSPYIAYAGDIMAARAKQGERLTLDISQIRCEISDYLNSDFKRYPMEQNGPAYGMIVYEYLRLYLQCLIDRSIPPAKMDRRIFRFIWEHKKCMHSRIMAVERHCALTNEISQKYEPLIQLCDMMRLLYAKYVVQKKDHILSWLQVQLAAVGERERMLLEKLLHDMPQ